MRISPWPRIILHHIPVLTGFMVVSVAQAQFVADGGTTTLETFAADLGASDLVVGTNGPNTTLVMTNGTVIASGNAYLGLNSGSSNNFLAVYSAGSRLSTEGGGSVFRIGNGSSLNRLLIAQGGVVSNGFGVIGFPTNAGNNSVLVTGNGSAWTNNVLYVGENGSGNSLTVASGGRVAANGSTIGVVAGASDNWVTLSGTNSSWNTAGTLNVGDGGGGSRLAVNDRASVRADGITVGNQSTSGGNRLSVAGANSVLAVTNSGGTAALDVRRGKVELNGGTITADRLLITNSAGSFTFNDGTLVTRTATTTSGLGFSVGANADTGPAGTTMGNVVATTIPSAGAASPYPSVINVANIGGAITKVTVTLSNLSHTYPSDLEVLLVGPDGQKVMLMSDVGGIGPGITNTTLTFDDASAAVLSIATNPPSGTYHPTDFAPGDILPLPAPAGSYSTSLADFNGSSANGAWSLFVSDDATSDAGSLGAWSLNLVTTVSGATWDVRSNATPTTVAGFGFLDIGDKASNARLLITNGAVVADSFGRLGLNPGANNNVALVAGAGSLWTNSNDLLVGLSGSGNQLVVSNGGVVADNFCFLGYHPSASNNVALVTGAGSRWTNSSDLYVGYSGSGNRLVVNNGGAVSAANVIVGDAPNSFNNRVTVDGGTLRGTALLDIRRGTNVLNAGLIEVDNLLLTSGAGFFEFNGGTLITRGGSISNGQRFVVGPTAGFAPAKWDIRSNATVTTIADGLDIGVDAANATLLLTNGGVLESQMNTRMGYSSNNLAVVGGAGSRWAMGTGTLVMGISGPTNTLIVTNGGVVSGAGGIIGFATDNNVAWVSGAGSFWTNSGDVCVGQSGTRNRLIVNNGGVVTDINGILGGFDLVAGKPSNNLAIVTGAGSRWQNNDALLVGSSGTANQLVVSNGGMVVSSTGTVGDYINSDNNTAIVTGAGSLWTNSGNLYIGFSGRRNYLVVSNGGVVYSGEGHIGLAVPGNSNVVVVTGTDSLWTNGGAVYVGDDSSRNHLVVSNGGTVSAASLYISGFFSTNNRVTVDGGTLRLANAFDTATLGIQRGTNVLNAGLIMTDNLLLTNSASRFEFRGGTFGVGNVLASNGTLFTVGNGLSNATLNFTGNGTRTFANGFIINTNATVAFGAGVLNSPITTNRNGQLFLVGNGSGAATYLMSGSNANVHSFPNGLRITNNATLAGNGTISGIVTVNSGGTIAPGTSVGKIILNNPPVLQGKVAMEISKNGATVTNDVVQVVGTLTYGGSLTVSNLGPTALVLSNNFPLFSATSYAGTFSGITLPALPPGLSWTNRLVANGSIMVIGNPVPGIGGVTQSGTNLILNVTNGAPGGTWKLLTATNVVAPIASWTTNKSGTFDALGGAVITNGMIAGEPKRYFRIKTP